jgi:hypothetical protein
VRVKQGIWVVAMMGAWTAPVAHGAVDWFMDFGARYEDNIGLASEKDDKVDDLTAHIGGGLGYMFVQTATMESGFTFSAYHNEVNKITDISHYGVEADLNYRGQASPDLTAIWWELKAHGRTLKHRDSEIRDGYMYDLGATIGRRFNERFGLSGGYRYEERVSTNDNPKGQMSAWNADKVFDLKKHVGFIHGDLSMGADTDLWLEFTYKDGDEATSGEWGTWLGWNIDWAWDPAFGPEYQVWKIDAKQYIFDVGVNHQVNDMLNFETAFSYMDAKGDAGVFGDSDYKNWALTFNVSLSF